MAGTIVSDVLQDGAGNSTATTNAIKGSAKAWVNFGGGASPIINASFNVSSITYNSTGQFGINFTTAMTDANYSAVGMANYAGTSNQMFVNYSANFTSTASILYISTLDRSSNSLVNPTFVAVTVTR